jgi:hypothetical protein
MESDEDSVKEKLLSQFKSESQERKNTKIMDSAIIENEKDTEKIKEQEEEGDLRLHDAVYDPDNIEEIETLVLEEPHLVFERDSEGKTPLHTVIFAGILISIKVKVVLVVNFYEL